MEAADPAAADGAVAATVFAALSQIKSDIGKVTRGMPAHVVLDAYPDQKTVGTVTDILHEGKNVSNVITYGVKIRPGKVPGFFRSQMTANVSFLVRRKDDAVLVPVGAVKDAPGGKRVVSVPSAEKNGKPETREVKIGIETDEQVEIVSGLAAGDKVLVAAGKYKAQTAPEASPLSSMPGRMGRSAQQGAAPRPRRTPAAN